MHRASLSSGTALCNRKPPVTMTVSRGVESVELPAVVSVASDGN